MVCNKLLLSIFIVNIFYLVSVPWWPVSWSWRGRGLPCSWACSRRWGTWACCAPAGPSPPPASPWRRPPPPPPPPPHRANNTALMSTTTTTYSLVSNPFCGRKHSIKIGSHEHTLSCGIKLSPWSWWRSACNCGGCAGRWVERAGPGGPPTSSRAGWDQMKMRLTISSLLPNYAVQDIESYYLSNYNGDG